MGIYTSNLQTRPCSAQDRQGSVDNPHIHNIPEISHRRRREDDWTRRGRSHGQTRKTPVRSAPTHTKYYYDVVHQHPSSPYADTHGAWVLRVFLARSTGGNGLPHAKSAPYSHPNTAITKKQSTKPANGNPSPCPRHRHASPNRTSTPASEAGGESRLLFLRSVDRVNLQPVSSGENLIPVEQTYWLRYKETMAPTWTLSAKPDRVFGRQVWSQHPNTRRGRVPTLFLFGDRLNSLPP
ncbi:hypothetical protein Cob_v003401 [Colletotrichum orbiculare MAFF 240422]|uniref:Uncharacterized protein n=1 Tax=Colletotrichum orbiculare (strain 104-T / ATCC 96160 / CBS 514.97 / LARS 414 / MAFF 240422) TaxID=1213857 RepID=A0A484G2Q3_COLOR|nr:hypothetical protein Cob_v003401 [Colletotrichum orbiculare MAFF 240422]